MSLKENVDFIKKEISAEESYMENFFKVEKFYKKYKKAIFAAAIIGVVSISGTYISNYITQQNILESNIAYNKLLENPKDKAALAILKEKNYKLYEIFIYQQNPTTKTDLEFFKELAIYSLAIEKNSIEGINTALSSQSFLLKDFALFNKALIQAQNKQYTNAKESLKLIDNQSPIYPLANILTHFLITK